MKPLNLSLSRSHRRLLLCFALICASCQRDELQPSDELEVANRSISTRDAADQSLRLSASANALSVSPGQCIAFNTSPSQPSSTTSYLLQTLAAQSIALDVSMTFGQEDLSNGPARATLAKGIRLVQALDNDGNATQYVEFGDVSGVFGTAAMSSEWYGHYVTVSDPTGDITSTIVGDPYPTGTHDFYIGPGSSTTYSAQIDYNDVLDIDEYLGASIEMQAFLSNSDLASGTFQSGTAVQYLTYTDITGTDHSWQNSTTGDANYPTSVSSFDIPSDTVTFSAQQVGNGILPDAVPRAIHKPFDGRRARKPSEFRLPDNSGLRKVLSSSRPLEFQNIKLDARYGTIGAPKLARYGDVATLSKIHSNEVSPARQVWTIDARSVVPMIVGKRTFPSGTMVDYVIDAQTGELLQYSIRHVPSK